MNAMKKVAAVAAMAGALGSACHPIEGWDGPAGLVRIVSEVQAGTGTASVQGDARFFSGGLGGPADPLGRITQGCIAGVPEDPPMRTVDVGPSVTIAHLSTSDTLVRDISSPPTIRYSDGGALPPSSFAYDADWEVSYAGAGSWPAGSFPASLHTPEPAALSTPVADSAGNVSFAGSPVPSLAWPPTGADRTVLFLGDLTPGSTAAATCVVTDGAFEIPADVLATLPASGSMVLYAYDVRLQPVGPDAIEAGFIGGTRWTATYSK